MTNFEHFRKYSLKWLYILWLPKVEVLEERNYFLEKYPDAWAYYDDNSNIIFIRKEFDCPAVRIHEYGHWANKRIYEFMEALWEFPWWGLGVRSLFKRRFTKG